jgi:uncharacterized membrane protein YkoI
MLRTLIILAGAVATMAVNPTAGAEAQRVEVAQNRNNLGGRLTAQEVRQRVQHGEIVHAARVINAVRNRYPQMETIDAEVWNDGSGLRYVIKIWTADRRQSDRRRVDVVADAQSGQILYER